jgi:hypothetical protein
MVDEARDVAADAGVAAPRAVDAKDPDAAVAEISCLAGGARSIAYQLAGVIDDAGVLVDGSAANTPMP